MHGLCTICSFSESYACSVYHMLVLCTVCSVCAPYTRSVYRMLGLCTICSFYVPYARFMYHMLVLRVIYYAYSETQPLLSTVDVTDLRRRQISSHAHYSCSHVCVCVCPLLLSWLLHLSILSVNKMGVFFPPDV